VEDVSGAVVPQAAITILNQDTGVQTTTRSNGDGSFVIPGLPVGTYTITVAKEGFETFVEKDVVLHPTVVASIRATLTLGLAKTEVTVSATAVQAEVETSSPALSSQVAGRQAEILPLNGRNFQSLSALMPGVINQTPGVALNDGSLNQSDPMSINGMSPAYGLMTVDGIWNENSGNMNDLAVTPNPDTIQEVRVLQNNYSVQHSLMGGNVVLVDTKSGTKTFHGTVYEYFRNTVLDARNFFSPTVPTLQQNYYGYTVGGPIFIPNHYNTQKQKAFFFWSEQWIAQNIGAVATGATPTLAMRNGTFNTPITDPLTGQLFPETSPGVYQIPSSRLNSSSLAFMNAMMPLPNNLAGGFQNYINLSDKTNRQRDDEIKVDYNFTQKLRLMAEFLDEKQSFSYPNMSFLGSPYNTNGQLAKAPDYLASVGLTASLSSSMVNEIRIAMNNLVNSTFGTGYVLTSQIPGFNEVLPYAGAVGSARLPQMSFSGGYPSVGVANSIGAALGEGFPPIAASDLEDTLTDDWSWVRGNHYLQAGLNIVLGTKRQTAFASTNGSWSFSGQFTGNSIADFLLGDAASFSDQNSMLRLYGHYTIMSPYVQDSWKVTRRLTLTAGLRIEYMPPVHGQQGISTEFDPTTFQPADVPIVNPNGTITATPTYNPTNGIVYNGLNGVPLDFGVKHKYFYGPAAGFAWDIFGDGRMSLRGGYGLTQTRIPTGTDCAYSCVGDYPLISSVNLITPSFPNPIGAASKAGTVPGLQMQDPDNQPLEIQSYSLSLERRFGTDWFFSIAGARNNATHLNHSININQALPDPPYDFNPIINTGSVSTAVYAPYQGYGSISDHVTDGIMNWSALELNLRHPVGHNLFLSANYTWSHNLSSTAKGVQNAYNERAMYGNNSNDVPQVFALSLIWDIPGFKNASPLKRALLGGWRYSDITTIQSGFALMPGLSISHAGLAQLPDVVPGVSAKGPKTVNEWFNTGVFTAPPPGYFGNAGVAGIGQGPGFMGFDMALSKDFKLTERQTFQLRGELFNTFNRANFNGVSTSYGAGNFGHVTSAADPRIAEFVLRYVF